jgi:hypothetical protein
MINQARIYKNIFLLILLMVPGSFVFAQNIDEDLEKIRQNFPFTDQMLIEAEYRLYANHSTNKVMQSEVSLMKRNGINYYYRLGPNEVINNRQYYLKVDHENEIIYCEKSKPYDKMPAYLANFNIDSSLAMYEAIEYKNSGNSGIYTFYVGKDGIEKMDLVFSKLDYRVIKIVIYYNYIGHLREDYKDLKPRVELRYLNYKNSLKLSSSDFSVRPYLAVDSKNIRLQPRYSHYRLVNNCVN